jgi:hypothetical protein
LDRTETILAIAYNSKCNHGVVMSDKGCPLCSKDDKILSMNPPFDVKCINGKNTELKDGSIYSVLGIILDGKVDGDALPVLLLATETGSITRQGYNVGRFEKT